MQHAHSNEVGSAPPCRGHAVLAQFADYDSATGGYVYNRRICSELAAYGWEVDWLELPRGFPAPSPHALSAISAAVAAIPDGTPVLIDQVCLARMLATARHERDRLRWVEIFHHPAVHDMPAADPARAAVEQSERAALDVARLVVATSVSTGAALVRDYGIQPDRIVTAPPGFPRPAAAASRRSRDDGPVHLLAVGAVVPRKDYRALVAALAASGAGGWLLDIVGNTERDPAYAAALAADVERLGLAGRVMVRGRLSDEDLADVWRRADVFVSASRHEGFGMAIAEALGRGVPVVTTEAGAVADWLARDCAIIVPGGDPAALADALAKVIGDAPCRNAMADATLRAARALPSWEDTAKAVAAALDRIGVRA